MLNFSMDSFTTNPNACGKDIRKYIYAMGVAAILILSGTYIYEYHYVPSQHAAHDAGTLAQLPVADQFMAPSGRLNPGLGVNVAQPGMPPVIPNTAIPPPSHADGRNRMVCSGCHQVQGALGNNVALNSGVTSPTAAANLGMMPFQTPVAAQLQLPPQIATTPAPNLSTGDGRKEKNFATIYNGIKNSVVNISSSRTIASLQDPVAADSGPRYANPSTGRSVESIGSGIIVSRNGYILTNNHVIQNATNITITLFGVQGPRQYIAEVVKADHKLDLALLKINPDNLLPVAKFGRSDDVQVGDSVISIGSPFGLDQTVSRGIISGLRKSVVIGDVTHERLIQTDAAINRGNSGGALINRHGEVIGVNTSIYSPTGAFAGIGFAIPVKLAREFVGATVPELAQSPAFSSPVAWGSATAPTATGMALAQNVAAPPAPPIAADAPIPTNHRDGRDRMECSVCHKITGGGNQAVAWGGSAAQNVAAKSGPPISASAPTPGNHRRDGRDQMSCTACHDIVGGNNQPVAWGGATSQNVAAKSGPPISTTAPTPGNHLRDGRDKMSCTACHDIIGGGNQPVAWRGATAQNVAAPKAPPPIEANSEVPGNHRQDGRAGMTCSVCHQIVGDGNQPVAFAMPDFMATPVAATTTRKAPRIVAGIPAPHTDGREKMDCRICHQMIKTNTPAATAVAFTTPQQLTPGLGVNVQGVTQLYFEGAVIEPITPIIIERINVQVNDGAFVSTVYPDSAADRSGLQAGDIIFKLNGRWVLTPDELLQRVGAYTVGDTLRLGVYTGGQRRNLYLTLTGQTQQPTKAVAGGAPPQGPNEMIWNGMELKQVNAELVGKNPELAGKSGFLIGDVDRGSVAEMAGIRKGDLLKRFNGVPLTDNSNLQQLIDSSSLTTGVLVLVERNGRNIYMTLQQ
ncbi:MAG: magnetochrome domain-containing protein [Gammaproteobacteria bacterium]|nr:magnetochrome domain-containing protein [Gammaproteobacteria bacterium]